MYKPYLETRTIFGTQTQEDGNLRATLKTMGWIVVPAAFGETFNHTSQGWWTMVDRAFDENGNVVSFKYQNSITKQMLTVENKWEAL